MFEPITVLLQFGFLAILYLFLLWVVRSTIRDLGAVGANKAGDDGLRSQVHSAVGRQPQGKHEPEPAAVGRLVVLSGKSLKKKARFEIGDGLTLGRSSASQIKLEDPFASYRHARIRAGGSHVYVEDLDSTNGTFLNGRKLTGSAQLKPGDCIRIGDTELRYEL